MNFKLAKLLAEASKTQGRLDAKKITRISRRLTRTDLKSYLFLLKRARLSEVVFVETPETLPTSLVLRMKKELTGREVVVNIDRSLIGGARFTTLDTVLDVTIKRMLNKIREGVTN